MTKPWLFRGFVVHTRLHPHKHHFRYPALFVCFPLARKQELSGPLFSLDRFNVFSYHEADHGDGQNGDAWARNILHRFDIEAGGEIWLQTLPRILGFVFNPVSFWYCHDTAGDLRAVICEVNNTFGERHCYLLTAPENAVITQATDLHARKVFHVSPFFAIEGEYRFRFLLHPARRTVRIDYRVQDRPVLMTAVTGEAQPLCTKNLLHSLVTLGWATVMVVVRINWQALRLWLKGTRFHTKPQPPQQEISS
ncbi:MAG TPA: DUF1365 domain-containing protein [Moraxellaceae bacterium]|nr:DUF1365 domain-containing protein [Moraxellaceae bacterium]